ncbi:MAG: hypothetical protein M3R24_13125 [Chloroflexota bacterium]|nr:hypothetical protein [Chloroflexota bacterium]
MNEQESSSFARVLVVANSEATLTVLPEYLRQHGQFVAVTHESAQVLAHSAERLWDAVIIDLTPVAAGIDLVRQLYAQQPLLATIVLSSDCHATSIPTAIAAGVFSWLPAPCPLELVELAVVRARERRQLQRQATAAQASPGIAWQVVHTVNNQLAGITGLAQLHMADDLLNVDLRSDLEMILNSARRISDLLKPLSKH